MILPASVMVYDDTCSALSGAGSRYRSGSTTSVAKAKAPSAIQPAPLNSGSIRGTYRSSSSSSFNGAPLQREEPLRALLDEGDDQHQHQDLGEHRADVRLQKLRQHAQAERGVDGAGKLADATKHHHHERIDDVTLPEIGADIADLRQGASGKAGTPRP